MTAPNGHSYRLDIVREKDDTEVCSLEVVPDLVPAVECLRLRAVAATRDLNYLLANPVISPETGSLGEPYIQGFILGLDTAAGSMSMHIGLVPYFTDVFSRIHTSLVSLKRIKLEEEITMTMRTVPLPDDGGIITAAAGSTAGKRKFKVKEILPPVTLNVVPQLKLDVLLEASSSMGHETTTGSGKVPVVPVEGKNKSKEYEEEEAVPKAGDSYLPFVIFKSCLDRFERLAAATHPREVGGILLGKLCFDRDGRFFVVATELIPLEHTEGDQFHLCFTSETWRAINAAIRSRDLNEVVLGWVHYHGFNSVSKDNEECSTCIRKDSCRLKSSLWLSCADTSVTRSVFFRSWNQTMLYGDSNGRKDWACWGWDLETGMLGRREWNVVDDGAGSLFEGMYPLVPVAGCNESQNVKGAACAGRQL